MPRPITKSNVSRPKLRLRRQRLAALEQTRCETLAQRGKIGEVESLDQSGRPGRQRVEHLPQIAADVVFAGLDLGDEARGFPDQRSRDQYQRQDDDRDDDQHGDGGGKAAPSAQRRQQPSLERRENDRDYDGPENGTVERPQHPGEGQSDAGKQQQESLMFDLSHGHLAFTPDSSGTCIA